MHSAGGSIKITSPNAFDNPAINPNFLSTDFDFLTLVEAVKASRRFLSASAWKDYVIGAYGDLANANSDDEIVKYVRNNAGTVFHATGTASMSPIGAPWGVVDPDLKVKGVNGLRIVDGSVIVSLSCFFCRQNNHSNTISILSAIVTECPYSRTDLSYC